LFIGIYFAICFNEDLKHTKSYYAKVAGLDLNKFNIIENDFIKLINYSLFVNDECYDKYVKFINGFKVVGKY
jgi:hypothetical protein